MADPSDVSVERRRLLRRLLGLATSLVGLLLLVGAWYYFTIARPAGTGPAGPPVPEAPFHAVWDERAVLVVGLGDSITAGFGASEGRSYFQRLLRNPPDEFADMRGRNLTAVFPRATQLNLAVSGSTSLDHEAKQLPRLTLQPTGTLGIVVLTTGGNDLIHNYGHTPPREGAMFGATLAQAQPWIANFEARLQRMLDRIHQAFPGGCHVFLANIYDPTDGVGNIQAAGLPAWRDGLQILAAYNDVIARVAKQKPRVHGVNLHDEFLGHGINCTKFWLPHYRTRDPHYWYYVNLEDPNDRGYDAIRRLFLKSMIESLPAGRSLIPSPAP